MRSRTTSAAEEPEWVVPSFTADSGLGGSGDPRLSRPALQPEPAPIGSAWLEHLDRGGPDAAHDRLWSRHIRRLEGGGRPRPPARGRTRRAPGAAARLGG